MRSTADNHLTTDSIASAIAFINRTASHVFLTGKAGTGKTTFLKNLFTNTHKQFAIVAPTGIAALNAGGVTIHSQFLLPLGTYIPDTSFEGQDLQAGNFFNQAMLARKHPLNSVRKQVLRSIDLLVIDEVSMLRADILDAIDYRLKAARGNFRESFGGVQVLFIGDLYQLPPVVRREEENVIRRYYKSAWFFEARALRQDGFAYIELDKIFRQHDSVFIDLLNNLRNNVPTVDDIEMLNRYYRSAEEIKAMRDVITLTTHNFKADELNMRALKELPGRSQTLYATVEGEFPESMYPVSAKLELKVGAQIMFTKNDTVDKLYFNGKLATVTQIDQDGVVVEMAGSSLAFKLKKESWENKRYKLNEEAKEIEDEVIGKFIQYPVKLAWAITVHKSQGLTFDKAIIDIGQAFADGQVYVALSRLRSLDGLVMRTRIDPNVIRTDKTIVAFTERSNNPDELAKLMSTKQLDYLRKLVLKTFDFDVLTKEIDYIKKNQKEASFEEDSMDSVLTQIHRVFLAEKDNTGKFKNQLISLLDRQDDGLLLERLKKGSDYYKKIIRLQLELLFEHREQMKKLKRVKTYLNQLDDLDQALSKKLEEVDKAVHLISGILSGQNNYDFSELKELRMSDRLQMLDHIREKVKGLPPPKKNVKRTTKSPTVEETLTRFLAGSSVEDIARERALTTSTIESHLSRAVEQDLIKITDWIKQSDIDIIAATCSNLPSDVGMKGIFEVFNGQFSYEELRAVLKFIRKNDE